MFRLALSNPQACIHTLYNVLEKYKLTIFAHYCEKVETKFLTLKTLN